MDMACAEQRMAPCDTFEKETNLFELAREHIDYAFLLCLVGIDEVLFTLAATTAASAGESSYRRGERHERKGRGAQTTNQFIYRFTGSRDVKQFKFNLKNENTTIKSVGQPQKSLPSTLNRCPYCKYRCITIKIGSGNPILSNVFHIFAWP